MYRHTIPGGKWLTEKNSFKLKERGTSFCSAAAFPILLVKDLIEIVNINYRNLLV